MSIILTKPYLFTFSHHINMPLLIAAAFSVMTHMSIFLYPAQYYSPILPEPVHAGKTIKLRITSSNRRHHKPSTANIPQKQRTVLASVPADSNKPVTKKQVVTSHTTQSTVQDIDFHKGEQASRGLNLPRQNTRTDTHALKQNQTSPPDLLFAPAPEYPAEARWESRSGKTSLKYRITQQGYVTDIEILHTSGHKDLDWSAIAAIKQWRYKNGNSKPSAWHRYTFSFQLK